MRVRLLLVSALCALTLGGVVASSAHAVQSEWMIKDKTLAKLKLKEETVTFTGGPLAFSLTGKKITIECSKAEGSGKIFQGGTDEAKVTLTGCTVAGAPVCKVTEPVKLEAKSQLIWAGDYYRKLEPLVEGKPLATILFKEGECSLPPKSEVTGSVAANFSSEELTSQPLTFSEEITSTVNKGLKEAGKAELKLSLAKISVILSGKLSTKLSGANSGKEFHSVAMTKLCEEPPEQGFCPEGDAWEAGTLLRLEHAAPVVTKFRIGLASFQCTNAVLGGPTNVEEGDPLTATIETAAFTECNSGCETRVRELPYEARIEARGATGHGILTLIAPKFEFECVGPEGPEVCIYSAARLEFRLLTGGTPASLSSAPLGMMVQGGSSANCLATGFWEGTTAGTNWIKYVFEAPGSLYVTS